jgi:hypothetical protein
MAHRNRIVAFLILPVAAFLWLIGWTLTFLGAKQEATKAKAPKQQNLSLARLTGLLPEQQITQHKQKL